MEARILVLQLCTVDPMDRGLRMCARKACVVRRLAGCVFFVGRYRGGLNEDACASWKVLQIILEQLFGSSAAQRSSRPTYALYIKLGAELDHVSRSHKSSESELRELNSSFVKVRSVAEIFSTCSSTAVELLVVDALADDKLVQVLERASVSAKRQESSTQLSRDIQSQRSKPTEKQLPARGFSVDMLSRGRQGAAGLPSATYMYTAPRTSNGKFAKAECDVRQERCPWIGEMPRRAIVMGPPQERQQWASQFTVPASDSWKHQTSATSDKADKRPQVRNFVTVDYRSNRRSLRGNRSFREKKVQRHRIPAEMSAILSMFEQDGTGEVSSSTSGAERTVKAVDGKRGVMQVPDLEAPSGLTITTQSEQSVYLLWNPVMLDADQCNNGHRVIGYTVYLNGETEALIEDVNNCQVELFELQPNMTHRITVRTRSDNAESPPSETLRYTHRPGLHQLSRMPGQSCKALSRSMPVLPQSSSPADLRKTVQTPASPSPLHYTPGECSSDRRRRSISSSSSGIGTDSCPSPSNEHGWMSCADMIASSQTDAGWIDESFDDVRRLFLDHQDRRFLLSHKTSASLNSRRNLPRSHLQQEALASRARDLHWDSHFDTISGLEPVEAVPKKVTYYCSSV